MALKSVRVLFCEMEPAVRRFIAMMNFDTEGEGWRVPVKEFLDSQTISIEKIPLPGVSVAFDSGAIQKGRVRSWNKYFGSIVFVKQANVADVSANDLTSLEDREVTAIFQALQGREREVSRLYLLPDSRAEFWLESVLSESEVQGKFKNGDKLRSTIIDKARIDFAELILQGKEPWRGDA